MISFVVAVSRNGVIGREGGLPWHISSDLKRFKEITMGKPVVMGRKTWDSIGRPLPGRRNLVITRNTEWAAAGAERADSFDAALALACDAERVCVIGGAEIYALALPHAHELQLTEIDADFEGDAFFPDWPRKAYDGEASEAQTTPQGLVYRYVNYRRRAVG